MQESTIKPIMQQVRGVRKVLKLFGHHSYLGCLILFFIFISCRPPLEETEIPDLQPYFDWKNATIYFLLTDRFANGDSSNDLVLDRKPDGALLRNFEGGDIRGIIQKIEEGYFTKLGVNAIWFTPVVEQVHGHTDEGTGKTYGYHGYWTRDWTNIDPNFGNWDDLRELVKKAHEHHIRVVLDVVINHTGPVTETDNQWPDEWVRTSPKCTFQNNETTVTCTLVENLPDIRTESDVEVDLPPFLVAKWKSEGRYQQEVEELNEFFKATGLPRSPRHYIMKWVVDFIKKLGVDGFRIDTAKHTEPEVWSELYSLASAAYESWKDDHPEESLGDLHFYQFGEVYNYNIRNGLFFQMGEGDSVNFYKHNLDALINFDLRSTSDQKLDEVYSAYSKILNEGALVDYNVISYISSHDDGQPYDLNREKPMEAGTRLILAPGACQIYYGDEIARPLLVDGANGDANLRSNMNWSDIEESRETREILLHWQKLGQFRNAHPAVGAGKHSTISLTPYIFRRSLKTASVHDEVIVAFDHGEEELDVSEAFPDGVQVRDYYSGESAVVTNGKVAFPSGGPLILVGME